jgi:hypothetical protein
MRFYILLLLLVSLSFAQYSTQGGSGSIPEKFTGTLIVNKTAPASVNLTDTFTVKLKVTNPGSSQVSAIVTEALGNVEPVSPIPNITDIEDESLHAAYPPILTWSLNIPAAGSASVQYTVKPKTVGMLSIGPTEVIVSGAKFFSNSLLVSVECTSASTCDDTIGETPLNCPSKCGGSANTTPPQAPNLTVIPTDPIEGPLSDPKSTPPPKEEIDEKTGQMILVGLIVLLVIAAAAYFVFFRKK